MADRDLHEEIIELNASLKMVEKKLDVIIDMLAKEGVITKREVESRLAEELQ